MTAYSVIEQLCDEKDMMESSIIDVIEAARSTQLISWQESEQLANKFGIALA